jgi:histidinol dehydrogenase
MRRFLSDDPGFTDAFTAFVGERRDTPHDVDAVVADVLAAVRAEGVDALLRFAREFDGLELTQDTLRVTAEEIEAGAAACSREVRDAIDFAAARIRAYHERQRPADQWFTDAAGVELGWRWTALESVGIYVPGGRAAYPSTVLMNAVPAAAAGVERIAMVTPPGKLQPAVLAAARAAGVSEIWRVGGAQAVAALAYGAGPIRPVDKIVGPGNAYVTAAKRRVYGVVGIDALAGPSEIVVVSDSASDPAWIAADLLSQAEHDASAQAILITTDSALGHAVAQAVEKRLETLERAAIAGASWRDNGAVIVVGDLAQAAALANRIAPEHLELMVADPDALAALIPHAGAIFLGAWTPEAIGDYVGGPNHVLPTARSARFSSGLNVLDFMKKTTMARMTPAALAAIGPAAERLAISESLQAHGLSVRARLDRLNG